MRANASTMGCNRVTRAQCYLPRVWPTPTGGADVPQGTCSYEGCQRPVRCKTLCQLHYNRKITTGELGPVGRHGDHVATEGAPVGCNCPALAERLDALADDWPYIEDVVDAANAFYQAEVYGSPDESAVAWNELWVAVGDYRLAKGISKPDPFDADDADDFLRLHTCGRVHRKTEDCPIPPEPEEQT